MGCPGWGVKAKSDADRKDVELNHGHRPTPLHFVSEFPIEFPTEFPAGRSPGRSAPGHSKCAFESACEVFFSDSSGHGSCPKE